MKQEKKRAKPGFETIALAACALIGVVWFFLPRSGDAPKRPPPPETSPAEIDKEDPMAPPPPAEKPAAPGSLSWPTYHGGPALTGAAKGELPEKPERLWRYQAAGPVYKTPVAGEGRIFFSVDKHGLFALDLEGKEVWSKQLIREVREDGTEVPERFDAPVACFESTVLAGASRGALYALDAATGDERWSYQAGHSILGTANLLSAASGETPARILVIDQSDGVMHCIDLDSGEQVWIAEEVDQCDGSPSVADGAILFGSCAAALHVFSAEDGAHLRDIEIDQNSQVAAGVAVVGDSVFSGSISGKLIHANYRTGEMVWVNEDSEDEIFSTPAVSDALIVFGSADGNVYALDRQTGKQKWKFETDGEVSSPVIVGDKVAFSSEGALYLLRLETGEKLWAYEVSDEISSPAVINNMLVVGGADGAVTAFGAPPI